MSCMPLAGCPDAPLHLNAPLDYRPQTRCTGKGVRILPVLDTRSEKRIGYGLHGNIVWGQKNWQAHENLTDVIDQAVRQFLSHAGCQVTESAESCVQVEIVEFWISPGKGGADVTYLEGHGKLRVRVSHGGAEDQISVASDQRHDIGMWGFSDADRQKILDKTLQELLSKLFVVLDKHVARLP